MAKAGMVASLPARTTVLAAANPVEGSYNKGRTLLVRALFVLCCFFIDPCAVGGSYNKGKTLLMRAVWLHLHRWFRPFAACCTLHSERWWCGGGQLQQGQDAAGACSVACLGFAALP